MKKLSLTQYAKLRGISRPGAWKAVKKGNAPGVKNYEFVGNYLLIYVYPDFFNEHSKNGVFIR